MRSASALRIEMRCFDSSLRVEKSPWIFGEKSMDFQSKVHGLSSESSWTFFKVIRTCEEHRAFASGITTRLADINIKKTAGHFCPAVFILCANLVYQGAGVGVGALPT